MKTVIMRVDDSIYQMIKSAAGGKRKNISDFIEYATLQYLTSSQYVNKNEMSEILSDKKLVANLRLGFEEAKNGDYIIVWFSNCRDIEFFKTKDVIGKDYVTKIYKKME